MIISVVVWICLDHFLWLSDCMGQNGLTCGDKVNACFRFLKKCMACFIFLRKIEISVCARQKVILVRNQVSKFCMIFSIKIFGDKNKVRPAPEYSSPEKCSFDTLQINTKI